MRSHRVKKLNAVPGESRPVLPIRWMYLSRVCKLTSAPQRIFVVKARTARGCLESHS